MIKKKFESLFVKLEEMPALRKKIEELLAEKRNVALNSDREHLRAIYEERMPAIIFEGKCTIQTKDFINGLYENHKRWEKIREQKRARKD